MSNSTRISDGSITALSTIFNKYSHYQYLRWYSIGNGTVFTKAILQGWNGKKWVRAKAKSAQEGTNHE
jgi:hypothetical protein